jgi:choline dehydrogenase-like flavoprotein
MTTPDYIVIGSGGGGGTIAWQLAKAGRDVVLLEQGSDWFKPIREGSERYNPQPHDEYRFRLERPETKRRPRGDYNTFRLNEDMDALPFTGGWTGSQLGGGSVLWGGWAMRALPIDFRLAAHFDQTDQLQQLNDDGYAVADWPIKYRDMDPYFGVAETILAVCGDRDEINRSVTQSAWYKEMNSLPGFVEYVGEWEPKLPFVAKTYPMTPPGYVIQRGLAHPCSIPSGVVRPASKLDSKRYKGYSTREALAPAINAMSSDSRKGFWDQSLDRIWSDNRRDACTMCGFCGEFVCWGKNGPKSGSRTTTISEIESLPNVKIITDAKVFEISYDPRTRRASGVRYLDISDPDNPKTVSLNAKNVIVSCGAVQSPRLLLMSGPPAGLGNRYDQVGRNAMFHCFGLGATCVLPEEYQGLVHSELGHTGNIVSYEHYFLKDQDKKWCKGGIVISTAKKNPLENAIQKLQTERLMGRELMAALDAYTRSVELRITADDLPRPGNRVTLDPNFVDEYGLPVARITRRFGPAEEKMFSLTLREMKGIFAPVQKKLGAVVKTSAGIVTLISDHQLGTCRMGEDPTKSVVDEHCRLHDVKNVFVVDSSFMPTGLGVNPMVTVVANALRVGSWIVNEGL